MFLNVCSQMGDVIFFKASIPLLTVNIHVNYFVNFYNRHEDRQPNKYSRLCSCHFKDGEKKMILKFSTVMTRSSILKALRRLPKLDNFYLTSLNVPNGP